MTEFHWTGSNQRAFLECLAETGSVTQAAHEVSMSRRAAYNLRNRAEGYAFRIAWDAALLLARVVVADELMERALSGHWVETVKDPETGTTRRLVHDRPLGLALLSRLDRMCDEMADEGTTLMAAQIVAQDWDRFLSLVEAGADHVQVRDFVEDRHEMWRHGGELRLCEDFCAP